MLGATVGVWLGVPVLGTLVGPSVGVELGAHDGALLGPNVLGALVGAYVSPALVGGNVVGDSV